MAYTCYSSLNMCYSFTLTIYSGIKIFNKLPLEIKKVACNQKKFKIALKKFLHTHSFYTIEEYLSLL